MKILSVKFLNINSLKGEHEIRFDEAPFSESGLFAITGPTGAGKTTILDAITVALYGRVHRHDKNVEEIMSRHTAECYAEVEFEVKEQIYRSKWSLKRSKGKVDGTMQSEKMELAEVATGKIIGGHTSTLTKQSIVGLCGLDYNQFLRSVILSQGDFTRFLKADDNERSDLLEKITDTGIYSDISKFVFEKQKDEKYKLEKLTSELDDVEVLSEDILNLHKNRLGELGLAEIVIKGKQISISSKIQWVKNLNILVEKKDRVLLELSILQKSYDENAPDFKRLKQHEMAVVFRPDLVTLQSVQNQITEVSLNIGQLNILIPEYSADANVVLEKQQLAKTEHDNAKKSLVLTEPTLEKVVRMDIDLINLATQTSRLKAQYDEADKDVCQRLTASTLRNEKLVLIDQEIKALELWLNENDQDKNLEKLSIVFGQQKSDFVGLNTVLDSAKKEQFVYQQQQEEQTKSLAVITKNSIQFKEAIDADEVLLNALKQKLNEEFEGKTLESIEFDLDSLPSLIGNCELQYAGALAFKKNKLDQGLANAAVIEFRVSVLRLTAKVQLLITEREAAELHLKDLKKAMELEQRIQNYEVARLGLEPGMACPLCGSLEHPFAEGHYMNEPTSLEVKNKKQELNVKLLNEQYNMLVVDLDKVNFHLEAKEKEWSDLVANQLVLVQQFEEINQVLPKPLDIEKPEIISSLIKRKRSLQKKLQDDLLQLRSHKKQMDDVQTNISRYRELLIAEQGKYDTTQQILVNCQSGLTRVQSLIDEAKEKQLVITAKVADLLVPYKIEFRTERIEEIETLLNTRWNTYAKAREKLSPLNVSFAQLNTQHLAELNTLKDKSEELVKYKNEFNLESEKLQKIKNERFLLFGDKDPVQERNRLNGIIQEMEAFKDKTFLLLQEKQEQVRLTQSKLHQYKLDLEKLQITFSELQLNFNEKLTAAGFTSIEQLKLLFLSEEEYQRISDVQKSINSEITGLQQLKKTTEFELQTETEKNLTNEAVYELVKQLEELDLSISNLNQEIGSLNVILARDQKLKTKFHDLSTQIERQKKVFFKWEKLSVLIGSADGKKFRRFAQGLTLARLTDLANHHLIKLSDRYRILKNKEKDLELLIIDGYQADVVRPMATLSGGESFLVSLALALGLSDLASRKVQINSLFIDEGFGTLDADTLDLAISALENLQSKGKTIGIISHVEALKERIGTQIQLTKLPGGSSKIKVVSY